MTEPQPVQSVTRACCIASSAAQDLNDELTIILNGVAVAFGKLEQGHPARPMLLEIQGAAQRCATRATGLLLYSWNRGVRDVRIPFERLVERITEDT